jgi:hypothetical protein
MAAIVAVAAIVALVAAVAAFTGVIARMQRAHARREDLLINQLLHAVQRPWLPAPAETAGRGGRQSPEDELAAITFTATPEQLPVE